MKAKIMKELATKQQQSIGQSSKLTTQATEEDECCSNECLSEHEVISMAEFKKMNRKSKVKRDCFNKCHHMKDKQEALEQRDLQFRLDLEATFGRYEEGSPRDLHEMSP